MTQSSTSSEYDLPNSIKRPLWMAAGMLVFSLAAFSVWAVKAPISTTIRAQGTLASARPSYSVQHAFGGKLNWVGVAEHDNVVAGQPLFKLDVATQQSNLEMLQEQIADIVAENKLINSILSGQTDLASKQTHDVIFVRYAELKNQLDIKTEASVANLVSTQRYLDETRNSYSKLKRRLERARDRAGKLGRLAVKGVVSEAEIDAQLDLLLELESLQSSEQASLIKIQEDVNQARLKNNSLQAEYKLSLLDQLFQNRKRLPELQRAYLALETEISAATIVSPIDGKVVSISYDTNHMYVARGTTLVTLSQRLDYPRVKMIIPTDAIDQVRIGMSGTLTIPSLPQRNLPQIRVTVTSIAPDAAKGEDGQTIGYSALAEISPTDLSATQYSVGDLQLASDMPVSISLEGRATTFSKYLFGPFLAMFNGALQD